MKTVLWIDDIRPAPANTDSITYYHARSVFEAIALLLRSEYLGASYGAIDYIDTDHDAGDFIAQGGDYIEFLKFLECTDRNYPIRIHSMNPVGRDNMRAIIVHNGWEEVK